MDITRLGIDISDCCNYLDSNKVTERKKRVLELKELLEISRTVDLLNENSEKDRGLCWDNVFSAVHRCLLKEIDRLLEDLTKKGKIQPATGLAISSCCGLQVLIVSQANTGTPYLACHELFSCILQILEQYSCNYKSVTILETYINILGLALSCEKYWGEIDFQTWKALLQVCVSLLREENSEKIKSMLMSVINVIILQGGRMTSLILKSKSLLQLFPEIFKELVPSRYPPVELCGIQLSYTMCLQFGKEFHLAVDTFIDEMIPVIIKLNDNRVSSDAVFKELLSQLLIEVVSIKTLKSNWQKEANSLLKFVENELADISKHKLSFPKEPKVITLGVKLTKYLTKEYSNRSEFQESEPKRRKTNSFIGRVLDNLSLYPHCPWPWLSYMDNLLEKAPEVVLEEDIYSLFEYFSKHMTLINDPICLQYMIMSSLRLINISKGKIGDKSCSDFLDFLWTTAVRFVNHPKLKEVGLTLVSNLLSNDEWINFDCANSILESYINCKIEVTKTSLKTLSQLSAAGFLTTTDIRIKLIHWYFSGAIYSVETLLCLILRSKFPCWIPTLQTDFPLTEIEHFHIVATLGALPVPQMKSSQVTDTIPLLLLFDKKGELNGPIHKLLSSFSKRINKKRYGPEIISKYVSVLAHICECDPDGVHIIDNENGKKQHILYYLLEFLNSPFHQLEKGQKELSSIYEETKISRYSTEDCAASPIHKLISKLVILATSSDDQIKDRAAECLGRIGPRNLNTLALQPDLDKESPPLSAKVVSLLLPLLVHNDLETCELAVTAIVEVFETKEGLEALDDLDMFQKTFLTPFVYHNKKTKSFSKDYSVQKLAWASMQDSESPSRGWCLWSGNDHSEWVRTVVSRLLASFNSGYLPLLAPLAAKENYKEIGESDSVESCARLLINDPQARMRYFKEMGLWQQLVAEAEVEDDHEALSHGLLMSGMFTCASRVQGCGWEAAWRLLQWNIEQPQKVNKDFSSLHYSALRSILHLKDKQSALIFLESAKKLVLSDLAHASLEVAASVYLPLSKLQLVSELEMWCTNEEVNQVIPDANWIHIEPLLMQRGLIWGEAEQLLSTAKIARNNSSLLIARSLINKIKKADVPKGLRNEAKFEEAQIHWESGSSETAKFLLKNLLNHDLEPYLKLKCLLKYGNWISETKSQSAKEIIEEYFKKVSHMRDTKENLKAFQSCPASKLNNEELKSSKIYQCNLDIDKAEIETICKEHSVFLKLAVREYLYSLQHDAASSDKMFRFVSLWLSNNRIPGLKEELDHHLDKVPSYRFIPVFPQLSVRISLENSHFSRTLTSLLERCSTEHPHHCLWHLLALANAEKDQPKSEIPPAPRVQGSIKLLSNILKDSSVGKIVKSMQDLALAYISFANLELPKTIKPGESFKIPKNEKLREMKDLTHIASATVTVPISKNADYKDIPGLVAIEDAFQIAGGINQPKKIKVLSSDGKVKTELVKGRDDIRQDALMQQVFSVLNTLLESDEITSRRRLNIRTYKVVPMTQKSGVIEWCSNTEPLGLYLSKAHSRHRPHDMSQMKCKLNLQNVAQKSNEEKLEMFKIICSKFKPVMRHFFLERYLTPGVCVATNSMIGYVMGIGDRHVFNILIDNETAEVIHIDFGISFELGRILPTPETVPFRLTRDIEDGMGITGVEGAFRKCCEETLRVLRKKSEPILTTLEALLYDPLYSWSVKKPRSEQSQQSIPDISMDETNKLAERFLQRLQLKLEGREDSGISSIEAQVRNLIIEAKDPNNLSRLFRGWQAYL
ncbi:unnamed protein product [Nezara viridula]|uniref:Serine/threonine-protein kinase ATM n=1 Tax=Nezara viridula TaxID=85310 RepID=A0A9P0HCX0_NEZVI|nr:unnamed protein product [Nezara viridula]